MLEFIAGPQSNVPDDAVFIYMNDVCFDITNVDHIINSIDDHSYTLWCLTGTTGWWSAPECSHDYFAFNHRTALKMREELNGLIIEEYVSKWNTTHYKRNPRTEMVIMGYENSMSKMYTLESDSFLPSANPCTRISAISSLIGSFPSIKTKGFTGSITQYNNLEDLASRFNQDRIDELQPLFVNDSKQPSIAYLTRPKSCMTGKGYNLKL